MAKHYFLILLIAQYVEKYSFILNPKLIHIETLLDYNSNI